MDFSRVARKKGHSCSPPVCLPALVMSFIQQTFRKCLLYRPGTGLVLGTAHSEKNIERSLLPRSLYSWGRGDEWNDGGNRCYVVSMIKEPVRHCAMEMEITERDKAPATGSCHSLCQDVKKVRESHAMWENGIPSGHRSPGEGTVAGWRNREQTHVAGVRVGVSGTGGLRKNRVRGRWSSRVLQAAVRIWAFTPSQGASERFWSDCVSKRTRGC